MSTFIVKRRELWYRIVYVEAIDAIDAINEVRMDKGDEGHLEYIRTLDLETWAVEDYVPAKEGDF